MGSYIANHGMSHMFTVLFLVGLLFLCTVGKNHRDRPFSHLPVFAPIGVQDPAVRPT